MRKPLSNKQRFEIFKRDGFTCQYCGAHGPGAQLQVDHIEPASKGGPCEEGNFITACKQCNSGKAANPIFDGENAGIDIDVEYCMECKKPHSKQYLYIYSSIEGLNFHGPNCLSCLLSLLIGDQVVSAYEEGYKSCRELAP